MVFSYNSNFTSDTIAIELMDCINSLEATVIQNRAVLQFGKFQFIYPTTQEDFPPEIRKLADTIDANINHCIINIYQPFTSIPKHIDDECLGPVIHVVSLNSPTILLLDNVHINIDENSLYTLTGQERHVIHSTLPVNKNVRYSITFRIV